MVSRRERPRSMHGGSAAAAAAAAAVSRRGKHPRCGFVRTCSISFATTTGPGACAAAAVKTSLTTVQQKSLCTHMPDSATPAACFQLIESKPVHGMKFTWDDMATLCQKPNSHDAPHACLEQQHTKDASLSAHKLVEICAGAPAVKSAAGRASRAHAAVISLALASVVALALGRAGVAA